jgi:opacity protein-like surface antigen
MNMKLVVPLLATLLTGEATAGTMGPITPPMDYRWVATLSAGPAWAEAGDTQTIFVTPDIERAYVFNSSTHTLAAGELFLGMQHSSQSWTGQLGVALALAGNAQAEGVIWDDGDPLFDNYSFKYKVNHGRVALKGKLLWNNDFWLQPWVNGSVGVGFNHAYNYQSTPLIFEALPIPPFSSHTQTSFAYTVGAGVQMPLNNNWQVGVGYEFASWGKNELGRAAEQTLGTGPHMNNVQTNGVMFNVTYLV